MKRFLGVTSAVALALGLLVLPTVPAHADDFDDKPHGIRNVNPGPPASTPLEGVALGSKLVFSAFDNTRGREPWITDGSFAGTVNLANLADAGVNSNPTDFVYLKGHVYFRAFSPATGNEIFVTNGSAAGTRLLKNIKSGGQSSNPVGLTVAGNYVYFAASTVASGQELWRTDGTVAGTKMVASINPGMANADITDIEALGDRVIFNARTDAGGLEPWVSDGTQAGTKQLPINPSTVGGEKDSNPTGFTASGDTMYFSANDGTHGIELWSTRGSIASTHLVRDINTTPPTEDPSIGNGAPDQLFPYDGGVLFRALGVEEGVSSGFELWRSDSTEAGTTMVEDIFPGPTSGMGNVIGFTAFKGSVYFSARTENEGFELWRTQGTPETTELFKELMPGGGADTATWGDPGQFAVAGPLMTFTARGPEVGRELFKTDGTVEGTGLLKDIRTGTASSNPTRTGVVHNTMFFAPDDGVNGIEIWSYTTVPSVTKKNTTKVIWSAATAAALKISIPIAVTAPTFPSTVPTGLVYLVLNNKAIGVGTLAAGKVSVRIQKKLPKGTYNLTALYYGSVKARTSTSTPFVIRVQ